MSTIKDGGPAFPVQDAANWQAHGLSLRDYFAEGAMRAICSNADLVEQLDFKTRAKWAFKQADAMIRAREVTA